MSDSQHTRYVRLRADVVRGEAPNEVTRVTSLGRVAVLDERTLFNRHQQRLAQILREYPAPGVAVFALHPSTGMAGHIWLAATDKLRAGTIGRHSEADLYLRDDDQLSLRHLLLLVKQTTRGLRIRVVDLATPSGFTAEQGGVLRAVEANGTLVLRVASYSLIILPTGVPPPWDQAASNPWRTLPARELVSDERKPSRARPAPRILQREWDTAVSFLRGPSEPGPTPLIERGEPVEGTLSLRNGAETSFNVGASALERGVLFGRYMRCAQGAVDVPGSLSRVHAALIRSDGETYVIDVGSTNGTFLGEQGIKCARVVPGADYQLTALTMRWQPTRSDRSMKEGIRQ